MSSPLRNSRSSSAGSDVPHENGIEMSNGQTRDDLRLNVLDEVPDTQGTRPSPPGDVENQNGDVEEDVDARTRLLRPGIGEAQRGGPAEQGPASEINLAEMEIKSLMWIKQGGNEVFREALETWQAKDVLFASRVDKKRKQSSSLRNEIYQLVGFDSVFQGVLLTAVAQSNLLVCHNWWTAFFLSLLASLVTVGGVIQKFRSVLALEKTISNEETSRKECINRVQKLIQMRESFSFEKHARDSNKPGPKQTRLKVFAVIVILVLLVFSGLFLVSIRQILCDSGIAEPAAAPSPR